MAAKHSFESLFVLYCIQIEQGEKDNNITENCFTIPFGWGLLTCAFSTFSSSAYLLKFLFNGLVSGWSSVRAQELLFLLDTDR